MANPLRAHVWNYPWGYCTCGEMLSCAASEIDTYIGNTNKADPRYADEIVCPGCDTERKVQLFDGMKDWERITMYAYKARKRRKRRGKNGA